MPECTEHMLACAPISTLPLPSYNIHLYLIALLFGMEVFINKGAMRYICRAHVVLYSAGKGLSEHKTSLRMCVKPHMG